MDHGIQELQELTGWEANDREFLIAEYRRIYERGWRASHHLDEDRQGRSVLERADDRGERDAWYHGYEDYACGYDKWHAARERGLF